MAVDGFPFLDGKFLAVDGNSNFDGKSPLYRDRPPVRCFYVGKFTEHLPVFFAVAPDADDPTQTLPLTLIGTLCGDLCLDAVACECSRLIRP